MFKDCFNLKFFENDKIDARHYSALTYALENITSSKLFPYITKIIIYGSCVKGAYSYRSDVDIFIELNSDVINVNKYKKEMRMLRVFASSDNLEDVEADLKFYVGKDWMSDKHLYFQNVLREGVVIYEQ